MEREVLASRCHDIQVSLGLKEVPDFEDLPKIGMMVNLSLHMRGLPVVAYDQLRLVAYHYFNIPTSIFKGLITSLAEIEFVKIISEGSTIKKVLPTVPFFENIYDRVGEYAQVSNSLNEAEHLALKIVTKLSEAPTEISNLHSFGAETGIVKRSLQIGEEGGYLIKKRARGKDIIISPLFFSENGDIFSDLVASSGSNNVKRILELIKKSQGWPLSIIESSKKINGEHVSDEEIKLIKRLAQDGVVKPPSINTPHSGNNNFIFTPSPGAAKLSPSNKEIYERAMALISSVRQGQLLSNKYPIYDPVALLRKLKRDGYLRDNSEAYNQYQSLALLKVGRLEHVSGDRYRFRLIEAEENDSALSLAISLLQTGSISNMEINEEARISLQKDQTFIESIIASKSLRETEKVTLNEETQEELENLLLKGLQWLKTGYLN